MKKRFIRTSIQWLSALLCTICLLCITACASTSKTALDPSSPEAAKKLLEGTWFFDYGYNMDLKADDQVTFYKDGTFETHHVDQWYSEWDKGVYSLEKDEQGQVILILNVKQVKEQLDASWIDVDISTMYTTDIREDEFFLYRFKRDRTRMIGDIQLFDPAVYNHAYRVKNLSEDQLIGTWKASEELFMSFNEDGTCITRALTGHYPTGPFELEKEKNGTELHYTINQVKPSLDAEPNPLSDFSEYIYDIWSAGNDILIMRQTAAIVDGKKFTDYPEQQYTVYYRDVPLVKYTYHWKTETQEYTFNDYWPKGREYNLLDSSKVNYITNIPGQYLDQQILGCYDNETLSGSPLTSIRAADNTVDREFWINWAIKSHHNGGETEFCHSSAVPARDIFPDFSFKAGDTVTILFEADLSNDITGWSQIKFWNSQGMIGIGEREIHTQNRKLYAVYNVETSADSFDEVLDFEYVYNKESGPVVFSNWKLAILDDSNSYKVDYHFGDLTYTELAYTGSDRTLPEDLMYFVNLNWELAQQEIAGWYENPSFTGTPVAAIPAGNRTDKSYYAKINLRPWKNEWTENGRLVHDYNAAVPANVLVPGNSFNPKPGDTVSVYFSATLSHDLNGYAGLKLQGDRFFEQDWSYIKTENRKLSRTFKIKINSNAWIPSTANLSFDFGYSSDACDEFITFSDLEFVILDDSNSYTINYHIGDLTYTELAYTGSDRTLPSDMMYFEQYNYDVAHNLQIVSWYDNDDLEGSAVYSITANSVSSGQSKDVYLKCNPIFKQDEAGGDGSTLIPALVFLSENALNAYAGKNTPITIRLTANVDPVPTATHPIFMEMANRSTTIGWEAVAWADGTFASVNNGILTVDFTFNCNEGMSYPSDISLMHFGIGYTSEFYDGEITFTDFKLEVMD